MTHFLRSETNPTGHKLEDLLLQIRNDIITRCTRIMADARPEAQHVLNNNMEILQHLTQAISLAQDSTHRLDKAFGPSLAVKGGPPRIGDVDPVLVHQA